MGDASNYLHTNGEMTYVDNRNKSAFKSAALGSPTGWRRNKNKIDHIKKVDSIKEYYYIS